MVKKNTPSSFLTRRSFLHTSSRLILGFGIITTPSLSWAKVHNKRRSLRFYHTHTQKELDITYAVGRRYRPKALRHVNEYLCDFRTGEVHAIDPELLDILWAIQREMGRNGVYEVISGYRSPKTNNQLRHTSTGVAKRSLHMQGKAIDVRFTGAATKNIRHCAIGMECGGVGYYAKSDFVHLDTGRFRTW